MPQDLRSFLRELETKHPDELVRMEKVHVEDYIPGAERNAIAAK